MGEGGLIGLLLFLVALSSLPVRRLGRLAPAPRPEVAVFALALVAVVVGFVAKGMVESIFENYRLATVLGLSLGMLRSVVTSAGADRRPGTYQRPCAITGRSDTVEIRQLIATCGRNLIVVFLAFALCVVAGGAAAYLPAKHYPASRSISCSPNASITRRSQGGRNVGGLIAIVAPGAARRGHAAAHLGRGALKRAPGLRPCRGHGDRRRPADHAHVSSSASRPRHQSKVAAAVRRRGGRPGHHIQQPPAEPATRPNHLRTGPVPSPPRIRARPSCSAPAGFGIILGMFTGLCGGGVRRRFSRVTEVKERIGATVLGETPRSLGQMRPTDLFIMAQ